MTVAVKARVSREESSWPRRGRRWRGRGLGSVHEWGQLPRGGILGESRPGAERGVRFQTETDVTEVGKSVGLDTGAHQPVPGMTRCPQEMMPDLVRDRPADDDTQAVVRQRQRFAGQPSRFEHASGRGNRCDREGSSLAVAQQLGDRPVMPVAVRSAFRGRHDQHAHLHASAGKRHRSPRNRDAFTRPDRSHFGGDYRANRLGKRGGRGEPDPEGSLHGGGLLRARGPRSRGQQPQDHHPDRRAQSHNALSHERLISVNNETMS